MKLFRLLNHIKLPYKMLVIALLALVAIAVPAVYFYQSSAAQEKMTRAEITGVEQIKDVINVGKYLAEHRGVTARAYGGEKAAEVLRFEKSSIVDGYFDAIETQMRNGNLEQFVVELRNINRRWDSLKANITSNAIDAEMSFNTHSQLIREISELISALMRHFQLSYDPQAATYHLIIANLQDLPRLTNALGKVRGQGAQVLVSQTTTQLDRAKLEGYLNAVAYPAQDFIANLAAAGNSDQRFVQFSNQARELNARISTLQNKTELEILNKQTLTYASDKFFDEYSKLINDVYDFNNANIMMLEQLLNERLSDITQARNTGVIVIACAFLLCLLFGVVIVLSILDAVKKLQQRFVNIASGDYTDRKHTHYRDEFGNLADRLSDVTQNLADGQVKANEAFQVKQALDNCSTAFLMTDANQVVNYINPKALSLFSQHEESIRTQISHFVADSIKGQNLDMLLNEANVQSSALFTLESSLTTHLRLALLEIKLVINPIFDDQHVLVGFSLELHDLTEVYEKERRTKRILESLNCTTTNVMIADNERKIIYLNDSVKQMLRECESDFRRTLPHFDSTKVLNNSMDIFHQNMAHQSMLLENLKQTHEAQIRVGNRHFRLIANPIFAEDGERIGTVTEWLDRTREVIAEEEIENMVQSALSGDFTYRVNESDKKGFLLELAKGLNSLVSITEKGLNDISEVLLAFANGDLTKRIDNEYNGTFHDLKVYCNQSSENLAAMIQGIREAAETINMASAEIAQGNVDLSSRTEEQASSLEQTASSMDEITGTVRLNAQNAEKANLLSSDASSVAYHGGDLIQQMVNAMADINDSAQKIANIITVIDSLAFQTNILALNAAVEAARAGEQGRGFAVVASEVRTLAQRSAEAAKDIKGLISASVERVDEGNKLVHESGETMKEIVLAIQKVNDLMSDIASASNEQAISIDEISNAISQMDEMTQQNAALVEEAAASSESLRSQSDLLTQSVFSFKLNEIADTASQPLDFEQQRRARHTTNKSSQDKMLNPSITQDDEWESF